MSDRKKAAQRILRNLSGFKVCLGCDSIIGIQANTCPNCHAYKFNSDPDMVAECAKLLSTREQNSVTAEDLKS